MAGVGNYVIQSKDEITIQPVDIVISDFTAFEHMLRGAIAQSNCTPWFASHDISMAVPPGATQVDLRAFRDSAEHAGAKEVYLFYHPYLSALGLSLFEKENNFILIDLGAGKFELAVFEKNIIVKTEIIKFGSQRLVRSIHQFIRKNYDPDFTIHGAISILHNFDFQNHSGIHTLFNGKKISNKEIYQTLEKYFLIGEEIFQEVFDSISSTSRNTLQGNGIYFTGGASHISGLKEMIASIFQMKFQQSRNPMDDTMIGLRKVIEAPKKYQSYMPL